MVEFVSSDFFIGYVFLAINGFLISIAMALVFVKFVTRDILQQDTDSEVDSEVELEIEELSHTDVLEHEINELDIPEHTNVTEVENLVSKELVFTPIAHKLSHTNSPVVDCNINEELVAKLTELIEKQSSFE